MSTIVVIIYFPITNYDKGFFHIFCITGIFIYSSGDSSYKMLAYAITWEVEQIAIICTFAWVIKTRTDEKAPTRQSSESSFKSTGYGKPLLTEQHSNTNDDISAPLVIRTSQIPGVQNE
jgi:hypothetical protein